MSKQRLELEGGKGNAQRVKRGRIRDLMAGKVELAEALTVSAADVAALREQAYAQYHAGKWRECAAMIGGLHALGAPELLDSVILSRCHQELGDLERAAICARIGEELLARALAGGRGGESS